MRTFLSFFLLFFLLNRSNAQKTLIIGYYEKNRSSKADTAVYLCLSKDSVKQISCAFVHHRKDLWFQIKVGSWSIISVADTGICAEFKFSDSTFRIVTFYPKFNDSIPANKSRKPDGYSLFTDGLFFSKIIGENGLVNNLFETIESTHL